MSNHKDTIYQTALQDVNQFCFDEHVVQVFKDMIERSVPGYPLILNLLGVISSYYAQDDSNYYDLGCSLGASTLALASQIHTNNATLFALDTSAPMIERAEKNIAQFLQQSPKDNIQAQVLHKDICDHEYEDACVSVLNFTLQFIPVKQRLNLLTRLADASKTGGVLLLSEKIQFNDPKEEAILFDLHHQFKRLNGYSDLEISQKREALEEVLIPESIETHKQRLLDAGFSSVHVCLQCFNFVSLIAIK